jgi:predicted RNA binding protein YcfA (HicA-like mRNA interferase family)
MMHIEKSGFRRGEYVAHLDGAHRVMRWDKGWRCIMPVHGVMAVLQRDTLRELDALVALARNCSNFEQFEKEKRGMR